jgi:hypothetical protein
MIIFDRIVTCAVSEVGKSGILVEGLRIAFEVKKDGSSKENTAQVQIFNLNEAHRGFLEKTDSSGKSPLKIVLSAGYSGIAKQIFYGDVTRVSNQKQGSDWVSNITAADGHKKTQTVKVTQSFKENVTLTQAINYLVDQLGFPKRHIKNIPSDKFLNGLSFLGYARDELDKLCRKNNLQWFIQDGEITVMPQTTTTDEANVVLSSETGLIGSPEKTEKGVNAKCLLNADVRIGKKVLLQAITIKGLYKVNSLNHKGNNKDGEFITQMELGK